MGFWSALGQTTSENVRWARDMISEHFNVLVLLAMFFGLLLMLERDKMLAEGMVDWIRGAAQSVLTAYLGFIGGKAQSSLPVKPPKSADGNTKWPKQN